MDIKRKEKEKLNSLNESKKLTGAIIYSSFSIFAIGCRLFRIREGKSSISKKRNFFGFSLGSKSPKGLLEPKKIFKTKKRKIIFSLFLILLIILPTYFVFFSKKSAEASWWDEKWFYRKSIPVTNSSGSNLTDFQIKILNNYDLSPDITAGKIQTDLDDLRFTSANGEVLNYWIEDNTNNSVDVWIKLPSIPTTGTTVYMYYGNTQASIYSDGNKVFDFFDDFNSLDASRWSATGAYSITDGKMTITTGAVYSKSIVKDSPQNLTTEMKAKYSGTDNLYSGICIANSQSGSSSNSTSKALAYNMTQTSGFNLSAWGADGGIANYNIINNTNIYTQTLNTDYIIGYTFQGSSNIKYFVKDLAYADLGTSVPVGTWNQPFYLWLGYYTGSLAATANIDDVEVDWVRIRKYASTEPTIGTFGTEEKSPSPVGHWSFDEGYGTTAYDESSNKNDGTIIGAVWKNEDECVVGKCLFFDGTDDSVSVGDKESLKIAGDMTLSAWIKTSNTNEQKIIDKRNAWNSYYGYSMFISSGYLYFEYGNGTNYSQLGKSLGSTFSLNKWHFVSIKLQGNVISYYLDGRLLGTQSGVSGVAVDNTVFALGRSIGRNLATFDGFIDEPKIYPYARSDDQIRQDYNSGLAGVSSNKGFNVAIGSLSDKFLSDGLVGHWKMDEISGTTVADSSGNGNTGTLTNAQETGTSDATGNTTTTLIDTDGNLATIDDAYNGMIFRFSAVCGSITAGTERTVTDYVGVTKTFTFAVALASVPDSCTYQIIHQIGGKFGNSMVFEGDSDYISLGNVEVFKNINKTVSFWAKPRADQSGTRPVFSGSTGNYYAGFASSQRMIFSYVNQDGTQKVLYSDMGVVSSNEWHLYTYSMNFSENKVTIRMYKDGNLSKEQINIDGVYSSYGVFYLLGSFSTSSPSFNGILDEIRVYNRALSPDEVNKLYEYAPGPIAYWNLDENTGTVINDKSENNYAGSLGTGSGMPSWTSGKLGNGLAFDSGKYAKAALGITRNKFNTNIIGRSFSYSLWFKTDSVSTTQNLLTNNQPCNNPGNFSISLSGGNIRFSYYGTSGGVTMLSSVPSPTLQNNQWYHLEWTKTFGQLGAKAYLNGIPQTVTGDSVNLGSGDLNNILLGAWNGDGVTCTNGVDEAIPVVSNSLRGSLDDVKIYNYIRSQDQVLEDMNGGHLSGSAPMEYWKFDGSLKSGVVGGSEALVFDSGVASYSNSGKFGKSIDLSILESGSFTWVNNNTLRDSTKNWTINQWAGYQFAQNYSGSQFCQDTIDSNTTTDIVFSSTCDSFTGSLVYMIKENIYLRGPMPNQPTDKITGALWFKSNGSQGARIVRAHNESFNLSIASDNVSGAVLGFANAIVYYTNPHDGRWHHLTIAWNGSTQKLYYDGEFVASSEITGTLSSLNKILTIGARNDGNAEYFNGLIDEVKIYNYALSDEEIKTLYNQNSSLAMGGEGGNADNNGTIVTGEAAKYCVPGDNAKCDTPTLELKMNEMTGTTVYDKSGNGNNATLLNSPLWTISKYGGALNFNGSGKRATLTTPIGQSGYTTASLWYKRSESDSSSSWRTLLGHVSANIHHLIINNTTRNLGIFDGSWKDFGYNPPDDGNWHFYEVVYNSGVNATLYVDGIYKNQIATTLDLSVNPIGSIGNWNTGTYWAGLIDEVKIYNYARTPAQIAWDYNQGKPIAHWKMDEADGTQVDDWSGNANHGTMTNMDPSTDRVEGKNDKAIDFDGVDDYVDCGTNVKYISGVSYSAWIKPDIIATDDHIVRKYSDMLRLKSGGKLQFVINGTDWNGSLSQASVIPGVWTHVTATFDDASDILRYYINGNFDSELSYVASIGASGTGSYSMFIGENSWPGQQGVSLFDGQIDDVKIYNYALTVEQVKLDYNNGAVNFR